MYSDIIENNSEVQPSVSTDIVDIKIEEPKVEKTKQRISDVSPYDYTREHVLYDLKVYLSVPISKIESFMSSTEIDEKIENISIISLPPLSEDFKNAEGQESLCHMCCQSTCWMSIQFYPMIVLEVTLSGRRLLRDNHDLNAVSCVHWGGDYLKVSRSLCCWRCY